MKCIVEILNQISGIIFCYYTLMNVNNARNTIPVQYYEPFNYYHCWKTYMLISMNNLI